MVKAPGRGSIPAVRVGFGSFILDDSARQLLNGTREIHLAPKAFALLSALVAARPGVLSKADLQERLWPETFVAEANLSNLIAEIRAALGDRARAPRFIRTAHGFGYAFCGEATVLRPAVVHQNQTACWLEWGTRRFALTPGENVVGRDPDVEIRLDSSTVSRRHARIVVRAGVAMLEDAGSKNGTFIGEARVKSAVPLSDGDLIHVGSFVVTFRASGRAGTTQTHRKGR